MTWKIKNDVISIVWRNKIVIMIIKKQIFKLLNMSFWDFRNSLSLETQTNVISIRKLQLSVGQLEP